MPTKIVIDAIVKEIRKNVPEQERTKLDASSDSINSDLNEILKSNKLMGNQ
jgi:hypothetical protein